MGWPGVSLSVYGTTFGKRQIGRDPSWWLADFVVAYTFPMMNEHLSTAATLACYAVFCALALVYVRARVPETKGRRLEELEALFVKGGSA